MRRLLALLLVFLLGPWPALALATSYYVRTDGNDANTGTSDTAGGAWRTIAKGCTAAVLAAGDVVTVGNGTYIEGAISCTKSGSAGNPIEIKAANRHLAILSSTSGCSPGIGVSASYIRIKQLRFTVDIDNPACGSPGNSGNTNARCWDTQTPHIGGPATTGTVGCELIDNLMDDHAERAIGLKINQDDAIVDGNQVASIDAVDVSNLIIRNNLVETCVPGSTCEATQNWCIVVKAGSRNARIYKNRCRINGANEVSGGILVGGGSGAPSVWDTADQIDCYNCVAWSNEIICVTGFCPNALGFMDARNSYLIGNTVINGGLSSYLSNQQTDSPTILNNIFDGGGLGACRPNWSVTGTVTSDYNDWYNCTSPPTETHSITTNPTFVNRPTDLHLQAGSPAIDAGLAITTINAYPSGTQSCCDVDYAGTSWVTTREIGAYTYGTAGGAGGGGAAGASLRPQKMAPRLVVHLEGGR